MQSKRRARREGASQCRGVFVHSFTAGVPVHTGNCCLQLGVNIRPFIYSSQQGSSSALDLHEARAQGLSDLCWIKAQQRPRVDASLPFQTGAIGSGLLLVFDGQQEMPESLKSSEREPTTAQQSLYQCYQCFYGNPGDAPGQIILLQSRGQIEVKKFLLVKWREVVAQFILLHSVVCQRKQKDMGWWYSDMMKSKAISLVKSQEMTQTEIQQSLT